MIAMAPPNSRKNKMMTTAITQAGMGAPSAQVTWHPGAHELISWALLTTEEVLPKMSA